jgi:hypothetical protein
MKSDKNLTHKTNWKLLSLVLGVIAAVSIITLITQAKEKNYRPGISATNDQAVNQALSVFQANNDAGVDMSTGPCLSNALMNDWVLDIVHKPRTKEDNLPENQCQAFIEGNAKHFVELDTTGAIVRVK